MTTVISANDSLHFEKLIMQFNFAAKQINLIIMKNSISIVLAIALASLLGGCASSGLTASTHRTDVGLTNNNYRIVATNITGEATSEGVIGFSLGIGMGATQFTLIPLTPDRTLYKNAMEKLWANFEAKHGPVTNRTLALANLRYDAETLNTLVYTKLKIVIIADVIEFK